MSRIFLSHSSWDSRQAIAVKRWLIEQEPALENEIFLDLDPHTGIRPGERWKQALQKANARCEAVLCLLSARWAASHECETEYRYAETLNKAIVCARLEPVHNSGITDEWQRCDLFGDGPTVQITLDDGGEPVEFATEGLHRLLDGLRALGIGAQYFPWPPRQDPDRAPYRGWEPLEEADAAVFFGRDAQIVRGMDELRGMRSAGVQSLLVILGPSGAGKSSFLRAGLLPRLCRDDRSFLPMGIVRPERAVLAGDLGLAHSIHRLRTGLGLNRPLMGEIKDACLTSDVERLQGWLDEARHTARERLPEDLPAGTPAPTLILPLDQAEELFGADAGPQAPQFLELLAALLRHDTGTTPALILTATIRADRYEPLQTAPQLVGIQTVVFDDLRPLPAAQFKEVITGPAARAAAAGKPLSIEPALVDRLLADSAQGADTLPLLALTLQRLYFDYGADGTLAVSDYEAMGGMPQIVRSEIDSLLAADPAERAAQLDTLHATFIPWLATINPENHQPMRRLARYSDLPADSGALIDALVEKRLLVKDIRNGQVVVEVALESLLRQWDKLAGWLDTESQDLENADALERAAAEWQSNDRQDAWLLEGVRLADAEALAGKRGFRDRLDPVREFLVASRTRENNRINAERRRHEAELQAAEALAAAESKAKQEAQAHATVLRRRSRILWSVLAVTLVIAVVAVFGLVQARIAQRRADTRTREAIALRLTSEGQSMLAGIQTGGDVRAFQEILAAQHITSKADKGAMFTAAMKLRRTLKIIQTPAAVRGVAFSPHGHRIVSGGADNTVRVWDAATGQPLGAPMTGHTGALNSVAFSPDGRRIASGGEDNVVRMWDAATGQPVGSPMTGHKGYVTSVAFSPDGQRIASGSRDETVRVWDTATGQPVGPPMMGHKGWVTSVAFSPSGQQIVSGGYDGTVRVWDAATGQPVGSPIAGQTAWVTSVAFSPDGHRILSGGGDSPLRLWDAVTGQPAGPPIIDPSRWDLGIAFSADGRRIVSGGFDGTVRVWDAATGQAVGEPLIGHTSGASSVAVSPDGQRIVSGAMDGTVRVWDVSTVDFIDTHSEAVNNLAFSPDGHRIVAGGRDGTVRLWDVATGQPVAPPITGHNGSVAGVAFSPDGRRIASGGRDGTVRIWDAATGQPLGPPMIGHTSWVISVAFSPDGRHIASGSYDGTLRMWDAATGQPIGPPITHPSHVQTVVFSPDGRRIVSACWDGTVRVWDAATEQPVGQPMTGHAGAVMTVAFSPDGHRMVSGSQDNTVRMWDASTGKPLGQPMTGHTGVVDGVAFSPDGRHIVSGAWDDTVRVWDAATRQPAGQPLTGHIGPVFSVAFSPDGQRIVSGSWDGTLRIWPSPESGEDQLCAKLSANISRQHWREWISPDLHYVKICPDLPIQPDDSSR
ncbi:nSTAND1 domain-containing NTPase [Nocardia niigatensis]